MRTLLVVNPHATTTDGRVRDVLVSALSADLQVQVAPTKGRGHAVELGVMAAEEGFDLVVALGGDGTVNELVNGLLHKGPGPDVPAFAAVPGGSTNVFARALGYATNAVEAVGELLEALREGRSRYIGLGRSHDRYFTFCAGLGLDATAVRRVERKRADGRGLSNGLYVRSTLHSFFFGTDRRDPPLQVSVPGQDEPVPVFVALVGNTSPWTYLGARPLSPSPRASFDTGLDVFALRRLGTATTIRAATQLFRDGVEPHGRNVVGLHDLTAVTLTATEGELPLQFDGEDLGDVRSVTLRSVPRALRVIA